MRSLLSIYSEMAAAVLSLQVNRNAVLSTMFILPRY
jgi:hypothetical protein